MISVNSTLTQISQSNPSKKAPIQISLKTISSVIKNYVRRINL